MKKVLLFTLVLATSVVFGQDNSVKLRIGSLALKTTYLEYERALNDKSSVTGAFHYTRWTATQLEDVFQDDEDLNDVLNLETPVLSGFGLTFEYRMYTSGDKEGLHGFYFAPFIRHSQYKISFNSQLETDLGQPFEADYSLKLKNNFGVGVGIGTHFRAGEHISIDVTWIGLGVSFSKIQGEITTNDPTIDFRDAEQDIEEDVADDTYLESYSITQNKVTVDSKGFTLPIIRGNIAIGYTF